MKRANELSWSVTLLASLCFTPTQVQAQRPAAITVFEGERLIAGDGSAPVENAAFVVENGRFTAVGRKG